MLGMGMGYSDEIFCLFTLPTKVHQNDAETCHVYWPTNLISQQALWVTPDAEPLKAYYIQIKYIK